MSRVHPRKNPLGLARATGTPLSAVATHAAARRGDAARLPWLRLDVDAQILWRDGIQVPLRTKTWAVLRYLAERPGVLVTKRELLDAVWPDVVVTQGTLGKSIGELREALGGEAHPSRFIVTVHGRGVRLDGPIQVAGGGGPASVTGSTRTLARGVRAGLFVGRDDALARLRLAFSEASAGSRRVAFVTGEPGIGKTTLTAAFVRSLAEKAGPGVAAATGRAASELSEVEPYFPLLEAFRELSNGPHRAAVVDVLRESAPPWLRDAVGVEAPDNASTAPAAVPPGRMLLALARALEALTRTTPVVLVLEDLHWADPSTLALLGLLARRSEPSRLLVVVTYRPAEAVLRCEALERLRREMLGDPRAVHVPLAPFSETDTADFLRARFGGAEPPDGLAATLHATTDGNPLFLATAVDRLVERGCVQHAGDRLVLRASLDAIAESLPGDLTALVENEMRQLSPEELRVLQAGSVAGPAFVVQEVAAALEADVEDVERCLEGLALSYRFVRAIGAEEWPDGAMGSRWGFVHALHRLGLLARVSAARKQRWHRRIGERVEAGWSGRLDDRAMSLAAHFDACGDRGRALEYLDAAAGVAERRHAPAEARRFLERALQRVVGGRQAEAADRELGLRLRVALAINAAEGYGSPELRSHLRRASDLCRDRGYERLRFRLGFGIVSSSIAANDPQVTTHLQVLQGQADALDEPAARLLCEALSHVIAILEGRLADAIGLERLAGAGSRVDDDLYVGSRFEVFVAGWSALRRLAVGHPSAARQLADRALSLASELPDRLNEAFALFCAAQIAARDRDRDRMDAIALRSDMLSREHGYVYWGGLVRFLSQSVRAVCEPRHGGFDALRDLARELLPPYGSVNCGLVACGLAEVAVAERRIEDGLAAVETGLAGVESGFARLTLPELLRLRAALWRAAGHAPGRVREDLERARAVATEQGAIGAARRAAAAIADLDRATRRSMSLR